MNPTSSLRELLRSEIESKFLSFAAFAEKAGIHRSRFSLFFHRNTPKAMPFDQLIKITNALNHPKDHFFYFYIDECFHGSKVSRSRLMPLLSECVELNRQDCIENILFRLDFDIRAHHLQIVLDVSEQFLHSSKRNHAKPLFQWIVKNAYNLKAERAAVAYYGLFLTSISSNDNDKNFRLALEFEQVHCWLPEHYLLDGYLQLTNIYFNLAKWSEMEFYADRLRELVERMYANKCIKEFFPTERHPVVYYGQGYLQKGNALEHQGKYSEAELYIEGYQDLSWFPNLDKLGWEEVRKFSHWARANRFNLAILKGNTSVLKDYSFFLEQHPYEVLPSLLTILESANRYGFSIDSLLTKLMPLIFTKDKNNYYGELFNLNRLAALYYQIANYHAKRGRQTLASKFSMQALMVSEGLNNTRHFRELASLSAACSYDDHL
ncbi:hypothetical protein [Saccharibacillus kuerlensis]|uniref:DNA-binding protein n=1 Tax=Saccharibacillus kuerlensis TaxID=459527 RepID=A0ABQ2KUH5_9BACL|nr:hypothetical protein [Saccharibacillus kuerlensis]GGN93593.1 hypothetical protein GCM10010969_07520 [Saccharibacillus kuerlensis]